MTMITPSYLGETIEYSSLHACRSTLEDPTHKAFGHDRRHHLAGVVRPLAPAVAQREGERIGEVVGSGGR